MIRLRDVAAVAGDVDQGPLGEAVVERGRGGRVGVSRARQAGAGGDGVVDRGERAGDIEEPVRLGAANAELCPAVRLPGAVPERDPDAGGMRVADPGGQDRHGAPDVVHRRAQPGRHLPGAGLGQRRPRRFNAVLLVLVVLAHDSIVLRADRPDQGARKYERELHLTGSQPHSSPRHLGKQLVRLIGCASSGKSRRSLSSDIEPGPFAIEVGPVKANRLLSAPAAACRSDVPHVLRIPLFGTTAGACYQRSHHGVDHRRDQAQDYEVPPPRLTTHQGHDGARRNPHGHPGACPLRPSAHG